MARRRVKIQGSGKDRCFWRAGKKRQLDHHHGFRRLSLERLETRQMLSLAPLGMAGVVNTHIDGPQQTFSQTRASAVATAAEGHTVVVWASEDQDGSLFGVYGQRFDAAGARIGEEFPVNATTYGSQTFPSVAMDEDGDFVVTWSSLFQDGGGYGVYARRYNAAGIALDDEFRVNQEALGNQNFSSVAMDEDGDFVIAWTSADQDGDKTGVYARCYNSDGTATGGTGNEFRVNATTQGNQRQPDVSIDAAGGFFVVWNSQDQDGSGGGIYGRRYRFDATPLGDEFAVNTTTIGNQQFPAVDVDASGAVVVWQSFDADSDTWQVYAQMFDADGDAAGDEIFIASGRTASVAKGAGNDFVVAWETDNASETEILARHFGAVGQPWGAAVSMSGEGRGSQKAVSLASYGSRLIVVHTEVFAAGSETETNVVITYGEIVPDEDLNQPPRIEEIADQTVDECGPWELTVAADDPDSDLSELTYSLAGSPPPGLAIDSAGGLLSWTPSEAQGPGVYAVSVRVTDAGSPPLSDVTGFCIFVDEVNLAPRIDAIEPQTTDQGAELIVIVTTVDDDLPANSLTFSLGEDAPEGAIINASSGQFSWTPGTDVSPGDYAITVNVSDDGGPSLVDTETLAVHVEPALLESIADQTVAEGQTLVVTLLPSGGGEFADGVTLSLDTHAVEGVVFDPQSGEFTWTPNEDQGPGTYQFTVRASDAENFAGVDDVETFIVNVTEDNLAPTLDAIDDLFCRRGRAVSATITAADGDVPPDDLTFSLDAGDAQGAWIDPVTGEFTWDIPWWQPTGKYDISVTVSDDSASGGQDTATFSVIVNELGDDLVMMPILNYIVPEGVAITFNAALRKRGPATGAVTYSLSPDSPAGAVISPSGYFSWTPGTDSGGDVFEITVPARDQAHPPLETSETFRVFVQMPPWATATLATSSPPALALDSEAKIPPSPVDYPPIVARLASASVFAAKNSSAKSGADNEKEATKSLIMELMRTVE